MPIHFPFGIGLLRTVVSFAFLSCILAGQTLFGQTATIERSGIAKTTEQALWHQAAAYQAVRAIEWTWESNAFDGSNAKLNRQDEVGDPSEFDAAIEDEDSIEKIFCSDGQERVFGSNRITFERAVGTKVTRNNRVNNTLPLLE